MISGVRASSIRIESTSSTMAKFGARWTQSAQGGGHVVAQVVEAELVVGRVGDVGVVGDATLVGTHLRQDHADGQAEELVDPAHPLGVVLGQVVVDRDDVDALAGERVEVRRQRRDQGLALTGLHLGDVAEVQCGATHDLDVEVALAEHPLGRLADGRERLRHDVVERLALLEALLELARSCRAARRRDIATKSSSMALTALAIASSWRRILPSPMRRTLSMSDTRTTPGMDCRWGRGARRPVDHANGRDHRGVSLRRDSRAYGAPEDGRRRGPRACSGKLNRSSSVIVNPASSIAPTVSRARWHPPNRRGQPSTSRARCQRRASPGLVGLHVLEEAQLSARVAAPDAPRRAHRLVDRAEHEGEHHGIRLAVLDRQLRGQGVAELHPLVGVGGRLLAQVGLGLHSDDARTSSG